MNNQGKINVSEGEYTFPVEPIDLRIIKESYDLFERQSPDPEHIAYIVTQSWWKILDNEVLNVYSKKGLGFYYAIMVDTNYDLLSSGEDFGVDDIAPVVAPAFEVREREGMSSHRVGGLEDIQWIELEETFGLPTWENPYMGDLGEKVKVEWSIDFKDMGHAFIYDFKQYDTDPLDNTTWSVGGTNEKDFLSVLLTLYRSKGMDGVDTSGLRMTEQVDTELKYAIDQQYRNDPETRKEVLDSLDYHEGDEYFVGAYKELSFDVDPKELVDKLAQEKGYGRVVDEMLGGNGTAYFTSKGNVIKLTGDKSEYETANVIKGKNNKYIADVYESGRLESSHINGGEGYIVIMEELGLPKQMSDTFDNCCCGVNKPIYIEYNETPAVIHPPVDNTEECEKLHKNLLMIRQELTQYGIGWSDIGIDNLGMKNGKLALLDLGETTGGKDTGQTIELNESGADDYWEDDEGRITLQDILDLTKDIKIINYPTILLANLALTWDDNPEEIERISQVEVSTQYPILIMVDEQGELKWILDGNHRAQKALRSKAETVPAKLIKPSDLDAKAKRILLDLINENSHHLVHSDQQDLFHSDLSFLTDSEEERLNPNLGKDNIQEIVDKVYPHIVNNLGPSNYVDKTPKVELHKDIYERISDIPGSKGEHSATSKAEYENHVNTIYIYYPNMEDEEDIIKALLHEYTHSLQDPEKWEEYRAEGYENNPYEKEAAQAELKWRDYLVYLEDRLNEDIEGEQIKLDLPTPIGKFEFPVGYEDIHAETGEEYIGTEQDTVDAIKDEVRDEAVTYLFKKWDKTGINFDDLKLLGIPPNNSLTRVMLVKRYLKNTMKQIPVSHTFDCDDLSKMFNPNNRDYDMDYIEEYLCGDDKFWDHNDWYDYEWNYGMSDDLDEDNWKTIMKILGVTTKDAAVNLIEEKPQTEEEENIAEEKEEDINEIRSFIMLTNNDESEYAAKRAMSEDITHKLAEHFEHEGKLNRDDDGRWSWTIEANLLDYLEDDMWDNTDVYEFHPDYAHTILEDWLMDVMDVNIPDAIFESLMLEEFTFEDYDYGKRGDKLETETKYFDGYWQPDYDINSSLHDRLGELYHHLGESVELNEVVQKKSEPFSKKEAIILKHVWKTFTKSQLQKFTEETPSDWGNEGKAWAQLMKMFGISVGTQEDMATSTQLAKYALDNWTEDGDYSKIEDPIRDEIGWWDVNYSETGSQIEYKDGNVEVLAFSDDDAEHRAGSEFWDWDGETETTDYGDYEAYDSEANDPEFMNTFPGHPWLKENVDRHDKPYEFFTNIWDKHGPTLDPAVLKLYGVSDWSIGMLRRFLMDYLGGREQVEKEIREILPKVSDLVVCGNYEFGIFDSKAQVDKNGSILLEAIIDGDGDVTLIETDWEGKPITLRLADISSEEYWGMTKHPFRNPNHTDGDPREWDDGDFYDWEHIWGEVDYEIADCITDHFSKEIGKRFGWLEISTEYALSNGVARYKYSDNPEYQTMGREERRLERLKEGIAGDQEWHKKEQGDFFTLDGSENLGSTDIFKDDGFDIVHQYRGDVHLSDISPEESETVIPQGSKKIKKTVLKPRLDMGPFNIPVKINEHTGYGDVEDNPDLNPEVEEGDIIELLYMDDPYSIPIKTKGVVMGFEGKPGDYAFKILVNWIMGPDRLSPMALLPEADIYRFPKKQDNLNEQWEKPYNDPKAVVNGKEIQLDVADTEFLKQKGMMYKTSYPKNRGMLFLWDDIVPISMWMRNTLLPLDIIYMVDGEVVDYDKDVQPCEEQQCDTYGDVNANQVMELLSGGVDNYGISIGDKIELVDI